jgi:protein-S-isoprenylcysteine O-methyltransferase Ste14
MNATVEERSAVALLVAVLAATAIAQFVPPVRDYLVTTWMAVGVGGAIFTSFVLLQDRAQLQLDRLARFHWILLIVYLLHQFEEHGVDLLGRTYFFETYARGVVGDLGAADGFTLTPLAIYRTNTLFVWLPFLAAVWGHRRFIWPGLAAGGLVLANGLLHIALATWRGEYNPGLGSSVALFLPVAFLYFRFVRRECGVGWAEIAGGVLFAAAAHGLLFLRIRFDLAPAMPPAPLAVIALLPLIANVLAEGRTGVARLRHVLAIAMLPFVVAVLVPLWIARRYGIAPAAEMSAASVGLSVVALGILGVGLALFVTSLRRFDVEGQGTLAPWDPPRRIVVRGPYRHVRNPMISGVIFVLFGEALFLQSWPHAVWAAAFLAINVVYIPLVEEPQLRRRFGDAYADYCRRVPRFVPRLRPWTT